MISRKFDLFQTPAKAGVIQEQSPEEIAEEISAKLGSPSLKKFLLEQTMKLVLFFSFLAL